MIIEGLGHPKTEIGTRALGEVRKEERSRSVVASISLLFVRFPQTRSVIMDTMRLFFSAMLMIGLVVGGGLPVQAQEKASKSTPLAQELQEHDEFSTLVSIAKETGMQSTLASKKNFTVIAPTNQALSEEKVQSMSKNEKRTMVRNHLVEGSYPAKKVAKMDEVKTLGGRAVPVKTKSSLKIGDGKVVEKNVKASNGVIHAVDDVIVSTEGSKSKTK